MKTVGTQSMLLVALLLLSGIAQAGFNVVQAPPKPKEVATIAPLSGYQPLAGSAAFGATDATPSNSGVMRFIGEPKGPIEIRRGMGRDIRLADALRLIAPPGWRGFGKAEIADSFDANKKVTWVGGKPWTKVLEDLALQQGLSIDVDWNNQRVYVGKRAVAAPATSLAQTATPRPVAPPPVPTWAAAQGSTVRSTVEAWAQKAGWTLIWPMTDLDYRIVAPLSFSGSIVDATGGITKLYAHADRPLAVDIHTTQKVIVFSELTGGTSR